MFAEDNVIGKNEESITQAISPRDVQTAIEIIPDVEKLWPQHPGSYYHLVTKVAGVLGTNKEPASKQALLSLFTNMIQKPFLTNIVSNISCIKQKADVIRDFLNYDEIRSNKLTWIALAAYIGEIRSQIIPNFIKKRIYLNVDAGLKPTAEEMNKAIEENEQNKSINYLQQTLHSTDSSLTFLLLNNASNFPSSNPTNADFIQEIIASARLTAREQGKLQ
jgi:hypothetical protein